MVLLKVKDVRGWILRYPLAGALVLSLALHAGLYGGWRAGDAWGWWHHQSTWLLKLLQWTAGKPSSPLLAGLVESLRPEPEVIPLVLVDVDPTTASTTPPKPTPYYGALSSTAANPDAADSDPVPQVDGTQVDVVRLADNPRPQPFPLQPAEPPQPRPTPDSEPPPPEPPPPRPEPPKPLGDMAKAKPVETPASREPLMILQPSPPPQVLRQRPRTLEEARARTPALAGRQLKQEGGVRRKGRVSFNVKATAFGAYDLAFVRAVEQRWFQILDSTPFVQRSGKVVLQFRLNSDGRVTHMTIGDNDVGEILGLFCQRAVMDPAPYAEWPEDLRRMVGGSSREVTFTFYYH